MPVQKKKAGNLLNSPRIYSSVYQSHSIFFLSFSFCLYLTLSIHRPPSFNLSLSFCVYFSLLIHQSLSFNLFILISFTASQSTFVGVCPRGVMVKAMDFGIVVSVFEFQSHYYVHFRANTLGKGMNPLILPTMGLIR